MPVVMSTFFFFKFLWGHLPSYLDRPGFRTCKLLSAPLVLGCETSGISVLDLGQTLFDSIPVCGGNLKALRNFGGGAWKGERVLLPPASEPYSLHS